MAAAAAAAHADVVYDSLSGVSPALVAAPDGSGLYFYQSQAFAATTEPIFGGTNDAITGVGDLVSLTPNTGRALSSVSVGFAKAINTTASSFSFTVSFYDTSETLLAVLDSGTITLPAVGTLGGAANASQFNVILPTVGATKFNLTDTFYYIVSVASPAPGLGVLLYDYYNDTGLVGTDVGTTQDANGDWASVVYGTLAGGPITTALGNNEAVLSTGFTPAVQFNVDTPTPAIPEPSSYALMGLGLLGLAGLRRLQRRH